MINPPFLTLRRRCIELTSSAERERQHDMDAATLLLFYAAECGLKAAYMQQNNLKLAQEERGNARSARSYGHSLRGLIQALNIPPASVSQPPQIILQRTSQNGDPLIVHEACRYGEKIRDIGLIYAWLTSVIEWCKNNL